MYFTLICKCIIGTWKYFFDLRQEMPEAINACVTGHYKTVRITSM